jgi:hypothetical protein
LPVLLLVLCLIKLGGIGGKGDLMIGDDNRVVFVCSNFSIFFVVLEFVQDSVLIRSLPIGRHGAWERAGSNGINNFVGGCVWRALGIGVVVCVDALRLKWITYPRSYGRAKEFEGHFRDIMTNYLDAYGRIGADKNCGVKCVAERKLQLVEQNLTALNSVLQQAEQEFVQRTFFKGGLVNEHYIRIRK